MLGDPYHNMLKRSEDKLELFLSFYPVSPRDWTQIIGFLLHVFSCRAMLPTQNYFVDVLTICISSLLSSWQC